MSTDLTDPKSATTAKRLASTRATRDARKTWLLEGTPPSKKRGQISPEARAKGAATLRANIAARNAERTTSPFTPFEIAQAVSAAEAVIEPASQPKAHRRSWAVPSPSMMP